MTSFSRFGIVAASFLVGATCGIGWLKTSAPAAPPNPPPDITAEHHFISSHEENPPAADTPAPTAPDVDSSPPADAWARAAAEGDHLHRAHRFENLGASLIGMDPHEALRVIAENLVKADRTSLLRGFFGQLAQVGDASAAIGLAMQFVSRDERETALAALVDRWTTDSPDSLRHRAAFISRDGLEAGLGMELLDADSPDLGLAISWAAQVKDPDGQATLFSAIAQKMLPTDPAAAIAVGSMLAGNRYVGFLCGTLESWARSDPQAAFAWTAQITDPVIRQAAQESIGSGWAMMDDEQASLGYLFTIPHGPARTGFIRSMMGNQQVSHSPDEVNAWVAQLSDPADRAAAQALVEDAPAPVTGVGARLNLDNGMVIVDALVPDSPAARGHELKAGDRIMAVAQSGEGFVPVADMDLNAVVDMIRGTAGSNVQLQVVSPQPGGYGAAHLIQLTRAQLDHVH